MARPFPKLTHHQYRVLELLEDVHVVNATALLRAFRKAGAGNQSRTAFYRFMQRLVDVGFAQAAHSPGTSGRLEVYYQLLRAGVVAMQRSRRFYERDKP